MVQIHIVISHYFTSVMQLVAHPHSEFNANKNSPHIKIKVKQMIPAVAADLKPTQSICIIHFYQINICFCVTKQNIGHFPRERSVGNKNKAHFVFQPNSIGRKKKPFCFSFLLSMESGKMPDLSRAHFAF